MEKTLTKLLRNARKSVDFDPMAKASGELVPAKAVSKELKTSRPELTVDDVPELTVGGAPRFDPSKYARPSVKGTDLFDVIDYDKPSYYQLEGNKGESRLHRYNSLIMEAHDLAKEQPNSKTHAKLTVEDYEYPRTFTHNRGATIDRGLPLPTGGGDFDVMESWRTQMREYGIESIYMSIIDPKRIPNRHRKYEYIDKRGVKREQDNTPIFEWMSDLSFDKGIALEYPRHRFTIDEQHKNIHNIHNSIAKGEFIDVGGMVEHFKEPIASIRDTPKGRIISEMIVELIREYAETVKLYINNTVENPRAKIDVSKEHVRLLTDIKNIYLAIKNPEIVEELSMSNEVSKGMPDPNKSKIYYIASSMISSKENYEEGVELLEYYERYKHAQRNPKAVEYVNNYPTIRKSHRDALLLDAEIQYYKSLRSVGEGSDWDAQGVMSSEPALDNIINELEKKLEKIMLDLGITHFVGPDGILYARTKYKQ